MKNQPLKLTSAQIETVFRDILSTEFPHYPEYVLRDYVEQIEDEDNGELEAHLIECANCQKVLDKILSETILADEPASEAAFVPSQAALALPDVGEWLLHRQGIFREKLGPIWERLTAATHSTDAALQDAAQQLRGRIELAARQMFAPKAVLTAGGTGDAAVSEINAELIDAAGIPFYFDGQSHIACRVLEPPRMRGQQTATFHFAFACGLKPASVEEVFCTLHLPQDLTVSFQGTVASDQLECLVRFDVSPAPDALGVVPMADLGLTIVCK